MTWQVVLFQLVAAICRLAWKPHPHHRGYPMTMAEDVKLRTVAELLEGFGIPFDRWVLRSRAGLILDEFSAAIRRAVSLALINDPRAWFEFCGETLLRTYDKHRQSLLGRRFPEGDAGRPGQHQPQGR